jgi:hypothetical protein
VRPRRRARCAPPWLRVRRRPAADGSGLGGVQLCGSSSSTREIPLPLIVRAGSSRGLRSARPFASLLSVNEAGTGQKSGRGRWLSPPGPTAPSRGSSTSAFQGMSACSRTRLEALLRPAARWALGEPPRGGPVARRRPATRGRRRGPRRPRSAGRLARSQVYCSVLPFGRASRGLRNEAGSSPSAQRSRYILGRETPTCRAISATLPLNCWRLAGAICRVRAARWVAGFPVNVPPALAQAPRVLWDGAGRAVSYGPIPLRQSGAYLRADRSLCVERVMFVT